MLTNWYTKQIAEVPIITLAEAKTQLKVDADLDYEDDLITLNISAAQDAVSNFINRNIAKSIFVMEYNKFESRITFARNYENDTIAKVEYYAPGNAELTLMLEVDYKLQNSSTLECFDIKFLTQPLTDKRDDAVIITINQGFETESLPAPLKQAMMLRLSDFYERREDRDVQNNPASNILARAYRKY